MSRVVRSGGEVGRVLVVADTGEQVAALNAAIRDRLVAAGRVDDRRALTTDGGERVGVGDRVVTRRNDRDLDVANRETWTVTGVGTDGSLCVTGRSGERCLPAGYVAGQVELAYASTVYGAQGETVTTAHLVVGEHTGAAAAYVGMTRGREANIAHLVAENIDDARARWVEAFGRDRADLGPAHAAELAAVEADRYAPHRDLDRVLVELHAAWTREADLDQKLTAATAQRDQLAVLVPLRAQADHRLAQLRHAARQAREHADAARAELQSTLRAIAQRAGRLGGELERRWQADYPAASQAAQIVRAGPGRLGLHRAAVRRAREDLHTWAQAWRPVLPALPADPDALADRFPPRGGPDLRDALSVHARRLAEAEHPEHAQLHAAATTAQARAEHARDAYHDELDFDRLNVARFGRLGYIQDPAGRLARTEQQLDQLTADLARVRARVHALRYEPAVRCQPADLLQTEQTRWQHQREQQRNDRREQARARATAQLPRGPRRPALPDPGAPVWNPTPPDHGHGISR